MNAARGQYQIRPMRPEDAPVVARYHATEIPTGVLADLGVPFMTVLYRALRDDPESFIFVAEDSLGVAGFVCGVVHIGRMYRRVLRHRAARLMLSAGLAMLRPRMIKRIWNTLRYPSKVEGSFPDAELLSIVVDERLRGQGAAQGLLEALLAEFDRRSVDRIKVMVRADFARANAYYRKHGAVLAGQIESHGHASNVYVMETRQA